MDEDERRALIVKAAEDVFARMGYGDATMEEVARACGMAKKSIYRFFSDKTSLFRALIMSHDTVDDWVGRPDTTADPVEMLRAILFDLASFILSPRQVALTRLVIAESVKSPDIAEIFYSECIGRTRLLISRQLHSTGLFRPLETSAETVLTDLFLGAVLGQLQLQALILDTGGETLAEELRARVDALIENIRFVVPPQITGSG